MKFSQGLEEQERCGQVSTGTQHQTLCVLQRELLEECQWVQHLYDQTYLLACKKENTLQRLVEIHFHVRQELAQFKHLPKMVSLRMLQRWEKYSSMNLS